MAVTKIRDGKYKTAYVMNATAANDEAAAVKVDISGLTAPSGGDPTSVSVEKIEYDVGQDTVLHWKHTTPDLIAALTSGQGCLDWTSLGGHHDPRSAGSTGDITITTNAGAGVNEYTITLHLKKKD